MRIIESAIGATTFGVVASSLLFLVVLMVVVRSGAPTRPRPFLATPTRAGTLRRRLAAVRNSATAWFLVVIAALAIGVGLLVTPFVLVWRMLRRHGNRSQCDAPSTPPAAPPAPITPSVTGDSLASLPTEQLCRAWRVSYFLAIRAADPAVIDRIARTRRRYLDELERRDPAGFRRRIDSGARAGSDPGRDIRVGTDRPRAPRDNTTR